ncbi:hypothetical protein DFP72DRAFT_996736 [Ephemerocybe angulata]|nr:hypothetical protein DFP72DRAFT_1023289 [Tulosesus angulatus]KAF6765881.1 hypothetical protein DFP72DRAFT_996736 [Tulosesus angulatus]
MSLLQDVLKSYSSNTKERTQAPDTRDDSDDEVVNVQSNPNSPGVTRPSSPTGRAHARTIRPLYISVSKKDPLRAFPTEVSQKIFTRLSISDLAKCSRVSKKWNKSQTLNYVWFQHYRKENFHDESLPPGKWTKRESKQNWRVTYNKTLKEREPPMVLSGTSSRSGYQSGYQTPRELKEEQWREEAATVEKPGKLAMREMYKELGGRKARGKPKLGSSGVTRDKGGWDEGGEW